MKKVLSDIRLTSETEDIFVESGRTLRQVRLQYAV